MIRKPTIRVSMVSQSGFKPIRCDQFGLQVPHPPQAHGQRTLGCHVRCLLPAPGPGDLQLGACTTSCPEESFGQGQKYMQLLMLGDHVRI